jgi:hypothetical protein
MLGGGLAAAQLRNMCPRSGTGLIGNYVVDLKSGTIWSEYDNKKQEDSPRLQSVKKKLLRRARAHCDSDAHEHNEGD